MVSLPFSPELSQQTTINTLFSAEKKEKYFGEK
ncbi:MAG: hypothetical protein H6Q18_650 [Bacteroidetes bacterium]|nr:hypothetical protein [Bacteroidota bacterium]